MKSLSTEFKVGLFTLLAFAAVLYMFFVLSPDIIDPDESKPYYTIVDNASGIVPKTHVRTNGVSVGKVEDIELQASHTRINFSVENRVQIPIGSKVEIRTRGFLGETFLEIIRAPDIGEYIPSGQLIPLNSDQVGISQLIGIVGGIAKDIKKVTNTLAVVLGGEDGQSSFANILENLESSTGNLREILNTNKEGVQDIIENLRVFSTNVSSVMDEENSKRLNDILSQFESTMADVKSSANNVKLVSAKIEEGQGTLGQLVNNDETIEELKAAIKDVRQVISPATKLKIDVEYNGEFREDNTNQHYFNMVFRTRPDKFYLLGATTSKENVTKSTTVVSSESVGGETTTNKSETSSTDRSLKFNFQFGKRWGAVALRFGLFETTGGFAGDFYMFRDHLRFTIEAFDWDSESEIRRTAHVKAYAKILFLDNIFVMVGVDDLTRKASSDGEDSETSRPFFGAGLSFNDDDLSTILGTAAVAL
jgi:phospholipid/cholesterol/gamma-HCH transport system substrate-binding protein